MQTFYQVSWDLSVLFNTVHTPFAILAMSICQDSSYENPLTELRRVFAVEMFGVLIEHLIYLVIILLGLVYWAVDSYKKGGKHGYCSVFNVFAGMFLFCYLLRMKYLVDEILLANHTEMSKLMLERPDLAVGESTFILICYWSSLLPFITGIYLLCVIMVARLVSKTASLCGFEVPHN